MYVCMYVCMYVRMYVRMYVYIYIYIYGYIGLGLQGSGLYSGEARCGATCTNGGWKRR